KTMFGLKSHDRVTRFGSQDAVDLPVVKTIPGKSILRSSDSRVRGLIVVTILIARLVVVTVLIRGLAVVNALIAITVVVSFAVVVAVAVVIRVAVSVTVIGIIPPPPRIES